MTHSRRPHPFRWIPGVLAALALASCVSVPRQLEGEYPALQPADVSEPDVGRDVRWGGMILAANPDSERTCFEVLSRELSRSMRPVSEDHTLGRFIACKAGFHDPEVFARGREVTLTGSIERLDVRKVGEYDYRYPVVAADFITMWPERPDVVVYDYHDPFYYPYYWGPWYYPYPYHRYPRMHRPPPSGPRVDIPEDDGG